jgi:intracellular septation protein
VNSLFAVILLGGLIFKRSLLKPLFGSAFQLTENGWRTLTLRWGFFFILLAIVNEVVWRNFSTDFWVSFKLFGVLPLTILFAAAQTPLILHQQDNTKNDIKETKS